MSVETNGISIRDNTVYGGTTGIEVRDASGSSGSLEVLNNEVYWNEIGIDAEYTYIAQNDIHSNSRRGISVDDGSLVELNSVHSNRIGIYTETDEPIRNNQIFGNADEGVYVDSFFPPLIQGNQIYSNETGVRGRYGFSGGAGDMTLENNLIYANSLYGVWLDDSNGELVNNTIYQPVGDAIRLDNVVTKATLRNNIITTLTGYPISMSISPFQIESDYNSFQFSSGGSENGIAKIGDSVLGNLAEWSFEVGVDRHSFSQVDPQFVDVDGPDNLLGFNTPIGSPAILDDGAGATLHGTGWTQVTNGGNDGELQFSDNLDLSVRRHPQGLQSVVELELKATSPTENPTSFEFVLEASVFGRSAINQSIWLYNYQTGEFEQVDTRPASRFSDLVTVVTPAGDLSRFVEPGTGCIQAKVRFQALAPRLQFTANIDQIVWMIGE